jgi:small-conductance mechanosensitive channel
VLSTPPAFILSQDQTLRKKIQTQHKPTGKRRTHAAQNSKPAKKPATTQNAATNKSTNQKTIGINKHGTLLSSQTTEASSTKHNPQGRIIAPEQLF